MTAQGTSPGGGHTPGPWFLKATPWPWGFYPATAYDVVVEEVRGDEGSEYEFQTKIAEVHNSAVGGKDDHPSASEAEANARLIAAAPELLEACKSAIPSGVCLTNRNIPDDFTVALDCTMGDLRRIAAAIAKATGAALAQSQAE